MMELNNYVLFYKESENSNWQTTRLGIPIAQWEDYCKEQNYAEYDIKDLNCYDAFDLHLLTDIVYLDGKYYLPGEIIPYPKNNSLETAAFRVDMELDEDYINNEDDFEEVYSGNTIDWGWGGLWTAINTKFIIEDKTVDSLIVAQNLLAEYPTFISNLKDKGYAVLIIMEYSKSKWLAWLKDDKIRLIIQEYGFEGVETHFDVLVDRDWFFKISEKLINTMQKYADEDLRRYQCYLTNNHGKIN